MFDIQELTKEFYINNIDAILVIENFNFYFYTSERNFEKVKEIAYNSLSVGIFYKIKEPAFVLSRGLSILQKEESNFDFSHKISVKPKNKLCEFLIKFLSK